MQERWPEVEEKLTNLGYEVLPISTVTHENVKALLWRTMELLKTAPEPEPVEVMPVYRAKEDPNAFQVQKTEEGWRISGKAIERAAAMTYWEHRESVRRFQRLMEHIGLDEKLRSAGIKEGDSVLIRDYVLEWQD